MKFNVCEETEKIIEFIRDYYKKNELKGVVIGISGGKDSAVAAALFTKALKSENVLGIWMPCQSNNIDYLDAKKVAETFNFELKEFDLTSIYNNYIANFKDISDEYLTDAKINLKPRLRMSTLYFYASMYSKIKHGTYIVSGTSNKCERFVGYFTKGGDNVSDINPLANLTVSSVIKIGDYLGVPYHICHKTPSDGLSGLSDEDKLGFTYDDVEKVISEMETGIKNNELYNTKREKILKTHDNNLHKFNIPTYNKDTL